MSLHFVDMKNLNFSGKIARFFLWNESLSYLVLVGIFAIGIFGYIATPKQYNPEVTLPAFAVMTEYPGATAEEVENFLTKEMEEKMAEIPGVDKISSQSIDGGMSVVRVEFLVGQDLETSKVKVFSKVFENIDTLKGKNISQPVIKNITPDDVAVGVVALTSDTLSQNEIRERAVKISHLLQEIEGVANINVSGGESKALSITLDAQKLKEQKLTLTDIKNVIRANNGRALLGDIKNGKKRTQIEIDSQIINAAEAREIVLGNGITLGDVAEISDGYLEKINHTLFLKKGEKIEDAIYLSLAKRKGINTDFVMEQAKEKFQKILESDLGQDLKSTIVRNNAKIANDAISGLGSNLIQSIIIVSLVLYLFLGGRSAFLVAFAIPVTLLFVFFAGYIFDQTINRITLFALILSLGLLVDSATVVVENVYRHLSEKNLNNLSPEKKEEEQKNIITLAVDEVGIGLFLSTLTSVIVFLPMTQISGMMGPYMGPLSFFVPMALLLALVIAYVITPFIAYLVFKNADTNPEISGKEGGNWKQKISGFFEKISLSPILDSIQTKYAVLIRKILESAKLQKQILFVSFGALFLTFSFIVFELVHFQMLPKSDHKTFWVTVDFPEGTDEPITEEISEKIAGEISEKTPDIEHIQVFSGTAPLVDFNGLFRGFSERGAPHQASLLVSLQDDRKFSSKKNAEYVRSLVQKIAENSNKEFIFRVVENPPGPPVTATVVAKIKGGSTESQNKVLSKISGLFQQTEGIVDVDNSQESQYPKVVFKINSERAKENGIFNKDIYDALSLAYGPQKVGEFYPKHSTETAYIEIKTAQKDRDEISDFDTIFLKNRSGAMVPLSSVIEKREILSRPSLFRDKHQSTQYITGEMENRSVVYAVRDLIFDIFDEYEVTSFSLYSLSVKEGNEEVQIEWGGEFEMTLDNFKDLSIAMMVAFILVYAILVGQFSSFMIPLFIMATVPLAMLGILPGFAILDALYGIPLTATALIGFIALLGIVVNNAIIYLEYLDQLRASGMDLLDALVEAGEKRLRPIFLTSLTTVLGSMTIAADPVWSGLAWSIIFGLSLSTVLTLGIFPILYYRNQNK